MSALSKIFFISKAVQTLSMPVRMCNITPLEAEIGIRQRKFTENCLIWLLTEPLDTVFHSLSLVVYSYCDFTCFLLCSVILSL